MGELSQTCNVIVVTCVGLEMFPLCVRRAQVSKTLPLCVRWTDLCVYVQLSQSLVILGAAALNFEKKKHA